MTEAQLSSKEAIFQKFRDRNDAREDAARRERETAIAEMISNSPAGEAMSVEDAVKAIEAFGDD